MARKLQLGGLYRVVVTGDRHWQDDGYHVIKERLELLPSNTLVITGKDERGVGTQADLAAHILKYKTQVIPTEGEKYGTAAVPVRNIRMLEQFRPHLVLVFHHNGMKSRDTKHIIMSAERRDIEVEILTRS